MFIEEKMFTGNFLRNAGISAGKNIRYKCRACN